MRTTALLFALSGAFVVTRTAFAAEICRKNGVLQPFENGCYDSSSNQTWSAPLNSNVSADDARAYCKNLPASPNHQAWRLPTKDDLLHLAKSAPQFSFLVNIDNYFWTTSNDLTDPNRIILVHPILGATISAPSQVQTDVLCISGSVDRNLGILTAGASHTCAIDLDGVKCWGDNRNGELNVPTNLVHPRQVSAGPIFTCALDDNGVHCWGNNVFGQTDVPSNLIHPTQISAGGGRACVIDGNAVKCWGYDAREPKIFDRPTQISSGSNHTCAIHADGLTCWGQNEHGQINVPASLNHPYQVASGDMHTCALDQDGVQCWGDLDSIKNIPGLKNPIQIYAHDSHTCAIDHDGMKCWGSRDFHGEQASIVSSSLLQVATGTFHTCVLTKEGVKCQGYPRYTAGPRMNYTEEFFKRLGLWRSF